MSVVTAGVVHVDGDELEVRQVGLDQFALLAEDLGDHRAGHGVGGVDDDLELAALQGRPARAQEVAHVLGIGRPQVALLDAAGGLLDRPRVGHGGVLADVGQAGRLADGPGLGAGDLEAVPVGRVVACGHHHAARAAQVVDGEVDHGRIDEPQVDDADARSGESVDELVGQRGPAIAHVAPDDDGAHHGRGLARGGGHLEHEAARAHAHLPGHAIGQQVGVGAPDVVGLEDSSQHGRSVGQEPGPRIGLCGKAATLAGGVGDVRFVRRMFGAGQEADWLRPDSRGLHREFSGGPKGC